MRVFDCGQNGSSFCEVSMQLMGMIVILLGIIVFVYFLYAFIISLKSKSENKIKPIKTLQGAHQ